MTAELKVHPSFFREFATKTWISPYEVVRELIENAFDEDATTVIITVLHNGNIIIEDNAGMDSESMDKFLILGSPHKTEETLSPKLKRIRTGRYGTGRLSFLTSFDKMKIRTRVNNYHKGIIIDGNSLENLFQGHALLQEIQDPMLNRNGTEILLMGSKISIDVNKLSKEIKKLTILRYPLFEVYIKISENFEEWDLSNSQIIRSPDIQGYRIVVNIENPKIIGEIIIAKRPLGQDEKGIAIMVGNHVVMRSTFGFDNKLSRVTGYVKCDNLTSRFADKSALIENDDYVKFNQAVKGFIIDYVLPSLTEYEDVLITREESKIYKEIDKVMGQAVLETLETTEEIQGFESVEELSTSSNNDNASSTNLSVQQNSIQNQNISASKENSLLSSKSPSGLTVPSEENLKNYAEYKGNPDENNQRFRENLSSQYLDSSDQSSNIDENSAIPINSSNQNSIEGLNVDHPPNNTNNHFYDSDESVKPHSVDGTFTKIQNPSEKILTTNKDLGIVDNSSVSSDTDTSMVGPVIPNSPEYQSADNLFIKKTVRKPILKKTFTLKRIGYKVIPYEDESDSRYSFTNENIVFVNKAHSTYKAEAQRGDEFLFRHITNIVAEVVVGSKFPESRDVLEIQNKLISEAIKIHDYSLLRK